MKKFYRLLVATCVMTFVGNPSVTWADFTALVGSVSWQNHNGSVYDSNLNPWGGDDFSGSAGTEIQSPPFHSIGHPPLTVDGGGHLSLFLNDAWDTNDVIVPNNDSSGGWLSIENADFILNVQSGAPDQGYGYGIFILHRSAEHLPPDDLVGLSVGSFAGDSGMLFTDEDHPPDSGGLTLSMLSELGIEGYSSIGLRIRVAGTTASAYYWENPSDGFLDPASDNWIQFGAASTEVDNSLGDHYAFFNVHSIDAR